jgi:hypothetical protein
MALTSGNFAKNQRYYYITLNSWLFCLANVRRWAIATQEEFESNNLQLDMLYLDHKGS